MSKALESMTETIKNSIGQVRGVINDLSKVLGYDSTTMAEDEKDVFKAAEQLSKDVKEFGAGLEKIDDVMTEHKKYVDGLKKEIKEGKEDIEKGKKDMEKMEKLIDGLEKVIPTEEEMVDLNKKIAKEELDKIEKK